MKKYILFTFLLVFMGCDKDNFNNNNPYLPNYSFAYNINMSLPQYSSLQFPSNAVYVNAGNTGIRGVFVFNTGGGYVAFDAACPNQALTSCSTMTLNGINVICPCDNVSYSLFSGQAQGMQYPMKQYRVEQLDNFNLRVYN
ncbi:Rieske (2Fe-2S) protein [Flavobacterium sp.]|jgi:nitrite reductase/ring-hydroxylating ferredoxin subunit|uniref:Rieske (2Fe-2S) protein n=1 Tax=Flavobacterium sp. TaxID=239 RepID=UPI0037BE7FE2